MRSGAFEIEAVAGFQKIMFLAVQPNFKIAAKDMQEFLSLMRIGFAAAPARFDAEKMRFHSRIAPGKQFHADIRSGLQDFSLAGTNEPRVFPGSFEKRKNVCAIEAGDAAERGDRGAHLAAFEAAEKSHGHAGRSGYLRERESAPRSQAPEALTGMRLRFRRSRDDALAFQHMNDSGRIEAASAAEKNRALEQAHIRFGIKTVTALRALRRNEAECLPGAQRRRRNADAARHFADAQVAMHHLSR